MLDDGMALIASLATTNGRTVTYSRGADSVELQALIGQTEFTAEGGDSAVVVLKSRDFIFEAALLAFDSGAVTPEPGDQIVDGDTTYEVMKIPGQQSFRRSGPSEQIIRVYTKAIA